MCVFCLFGEEFKEWSAARAKRAAHPIFWNYPDLFGFLLNTTLADLVLQKQTKHVPNIHRPQTDFIRLVSSKLLLWGASRRLGRPF